MLIRWATSEEIAAYGYEPKEKFEVMAAVDRMSNSILGIVYFSRRKK